MRAPVILCVCLFVAGQALPQDKETGRDQAQAVIDKLKGKFKVDDAAPGKPIVELNLHGKKTTDQDLAMLKGLAFLRTLDLGHSLVTNDGLAHLKNLTRLEELGLHDTKITDVVLVHLKGLTRLKALDLEGTGVTDAGLAHLKGLTSLVSLTLTETKVSDAGVKDLQKALPKVKIER